MHYFEPVCGTSETHSRNFAPELPLETLWGPKQKGPFICPNIGISGSSPAQQESVLRGPSKERGPLQANGAEHCLTPLSRPCPAGVSGSLGRRLLLCYFTPCGPPACLVAAAFHVPKGPGGGRWGLIQHCEGATQTGHTAYNMEYALALWGYAASGYG